MALFLVLQFLNPALSSESSPPSSNNENFSVKKSFGTIFKNVKSVLGENFSNNEGEKEEKVLEGPQEISIGQEERELEAVGDLPGSASSLPALSKKEPSPSSSPKESINKESGLSSSPVPEPLKTPSAESVKASAESPKAGSPSEPVSSPSAKKESQLETSPKPLAEQVPSGPLKENALASPSEDLDDSEVSIEIRSYMVPFIYESVNQKDPFEDPTIQETDQIIDQAGDTLEIIEPEAPRTPPEAYELTEIHLKGIIWNAKEPKALFELPGGSGYYTLIRGDRVGKKGVIFEIRESEVVIVETNVIGSGKRRKEERVIKIKKIDRIGVDKLGLLKNYDLLQYTFPLINT